MIHEMILNLVVPYPQHEGFFMRGNCAVIARDRFWKKNQKFSYTGSVLQGIRPGKLIWDRFCKVFDQENLYGIGFVSKFLYGIGFVSKFLYGISFATHSVSRFPSVGAPKFLRFPSAVAPRLQA